MKIISNSRNTETQLPGKRIIRQCYGQEWGEYEEISKTLYFCENTIKQPINCINVTGLEKIIIENIKDISIFYKFSRRKERL